MKNKEKELENVLDELVAHLEDPDFDESQFGDFCDRHTQWKEELRNTWDIWNDLGSIEIPGAASHRMQENFYRSLNKIVADERNVRSLRGDGYVRMSTVWRWAAIFVVGLGLGMLVNSGLFRSSVDSPAIRSDHQQLLTQLTSGSSATDRLTVVQDIKNISQPENQVFEALHRTLINDPNVNVRLSAIESLLHFADYPKARELLVNALAYQDTPIVQITLAEVVIKLQEEGTLEEIRKLIDSEKVDLEVKMHLEETLNL